MADPMQDLDVFLTAIESKLRGPFSSLEVAKAVQTASLRRLLPTDTSTPSAADYLDRLSQVLHRTDKVTQLRILVGLLGLDPDTRSSVGGVDTRTTQHFHHDNDDDASQQRIQQDEWIERILTQAQEKRTYDEWVRVVAGLVQGIMFDERISTSDAPEQEQDEENGEARAATCRGEEANNLLEKTCMAIIDEVCKLERATAAESSIATEETADADPTFAPFRYALLHADLLEQAIPEFKTHANFQINESASILNMDANLDRSKAQEEKGHNMSLAGNLKGTSNGATTTAAASASATTTPTFPGFRSASSSKTAAKQASRPKSSMFLAAKKPTSVAGTALHTRKKGAAQALVGMGRNRLVAGKQATGGTNTATTKTSLLGATNSKRTAPRGRTLNATSARSKMKMIDVQEVQGLAEEQKEREGKAAGASSSLSNKKRASSLLGQKRKAVGAFASEPRAKKAATVAGVKTTAHNSVAATVAAQAGPVATRTSKTIPVSLTANSTDGALVSTALSACQDQLAAATAATTKAAADSFSSPATKQQDWREMLQEKHNRLSAEDRSRVEQFFNDKVNPTPDQPTYKMKLHEHRTTDAKTGEPVKETFYLELDYTNFTSKQSKKTKRYSKEAA